MYYQQYIEVRLSVRDMSLTEPESPPAPEPPVIAAPAAKLDASVPAQLQIELEFKPAAGKMTGHQCYGGMFA
jgi:hypothetical protein